MGLPGMVVSANSVAVGAMMPWAATYQSHGFRLSTLGLNLMLLGAAGIVASGMVFSWSLSSDNLHHTLDRKVTDLHGGFRTAHHEIRQLTLRVLSSVTTRPPRKIPPRGGRVIRYQSIDFLGFEVT